MKPATRHEGVGARALRALRALRGRARALGAGVLPPLLAALLLLAAFARPTLPWQRDLFEHVVVFDITQSMNVEDMAVAGRPASRLAAARAQFDGALGELPCGSRLGLAIFTDNRSYLLFAPVEVCAHRAELRRSLAQIDGRMAWSGNSEVAKGLHSGFVVARALSGRPGLVFVTDGHESPPLNPRHRPRFDDKPGEVPGMIVAVGEPQPSPIPKTDPLGRPMGFWSADEVAQTDPRSRGRDGSVGREMMVEDGSAAPAVGLGATPGSEHLSGLREPYLQLLAQENGLAYHRLRGAQELARALRQEAFARPVRIDGDLRVALAALAFALVLLPHLSALRRRRPAGGQAAPGAGRAGLRPAARSPPSGAARPPR